MNYFTMIIVSVKKRKKMRRVKMNQKIRFLKIKIPQNIFFLKKLEKPL